MKIIVPLAGPDYIDDYGNLRIDKNNNGLNILKDILDSRPWFQKRNSIFFEDVYFVLQDQKSTRIFFEEKLKVWYPCSHAVFIPHFTQGAAYTVLSAISLFAYENKPVCIDLADIKFEWNGDDVTDILNNPSCAGVIPVFQSSSPFYSYVVINEEFDILMSREKQVISNIASAGVYFFSSPWHFIKGLEFLTQNPKLLHCNLAYICPLSNAFSDGDQKMKAIYVSNVKDFHRINLN